MTHIEKRFGWTNETDPAKAVDAAARQWDLIGDAFPAFFLAGQTAPTQDKTFRAWEVIRDHLGTDIQKQRQQTGDCVAMSCRDVLNAIQILEIVAGQAEVFRPLFAPYLYAAGRVKIGRNQLKGGAGSYGSWQAQAVQKYGALRDNFAGVPSYSGQVADAWGDGKSNWGRFLDEGDNHLIQTTARIKSWTQLVDAITNGYLCTIASDRGFEMKIRRGEEYHRPRGSWAHQMGIIGISDDRRKPWVAVSNQWGDAHGTVKDFETGEDWPRGTLRVEPDVFDRLYKRGEIYAFSGFDGFPDRSDNWTSWSLI